MFFFRGQQHLYIKIKTCQTKNQVKEATYFLEMEVTVRKIRNPIIPELCLESKKFHTQLIRVCQKSRYNLASLIKQINFKKLLIFSVSKATKRSPLSGDSGPSVQLKHPESLL